MTTTATAPAERPFAWVPFPGPQLAFLHCPVEDIFFGGARGPGKTDSLLAKWVLHADKYGPHAKGIVFRESYPNLEEIMERADVLFPKFQATQHKQSRSWRFPNGARIKFRYLETDADADEYHGHEYSFIGVDELGGFTSLRGLDRVRACLRSPAPNVICQFVSTGNPGGAGHNLVKSRYVDPAPANTVFLACAHCDLAYRDRVPQCDCHPPAHIERVFIPASLKDNPVLLQSPQYRRQLIASANGDLQLLRAWLDGDWNITAGGMFNDLWRLAQPVIKPFPIPDAWHIDRAFDWGDSSPYACLWFAEANGEDAEIHGTMQSFPRGTLFVIGEEYGCTGKPNEGLRLSNTEIAHRIRRTEATLGLADRVHPGPADTQIFAVNNNGRSIAQEMAAVGVKWTEADKSSGSRVNGWARIRSLLAANTTLDETTGQRHRRQTPMETPGLFVFDTCVQTLRTVPDLPRDSRKRDDVDTNTEDHLGDVLRYRALTGRPRGGGEAAAMYGVY